MSFWAIVGSGLSGVHIVPSSITTGPSRYRNNGVCSVDSGEGCIGGFWLTKDADFI